MLHDFLTANRQELIDRCRSKVLDRSSAYRPVHELEYGITVFLDQLIRTLQIEQTLTPSDSRLVSGPSGGGNLDLSEMGTSAAHHGRELMQQGVGIDQVVHDYGDLCQAITDMAFELGAPIDVDEFRTLNRCLDNAIAGAVSEYSNQREWLLSDQRAQALNERLGFLAHELRNDIHTATLAVSAMKAGGVGMAGATGAVLDRSLIRLRSLIDRSLAEVRVTAGMPARSELMLMTDFVTDLRVSASLEAVARECRFVVSFVDPELAVDTDRDLLHSAVGNLLQNAFRFTKQNSEVSLKVYCEADRIIIDVEDQCGGLAPGVADTMFTSFVQNGDDRSGMGLGLSICRRSVQAVNGTSKCETFPARDVSSASIFRDTFSPKLRLRSIDLLALRVEVSPGMVQKRRSRIHRALKSTLVGGRHVQSRHIRVARTPGPNRSPRRCRMRSRLHDGCFG
jgi:signal transduction histidine kinase